MSRNNLLAKARNIWNTFFNKNESPREMLERSDLYKVAIAATYRNLRSPSFRSHSKETLVSFYDEACRILEDDFKVYDLPLRSFRLHVQKLIQPNVKDSFQVFRDVDSLFPDMKEENSIEVIKFCREILRNDRDSTLKALNSLGAEADRNGQLEFLQLKKLALEVVFSFYEWESPTIVDYSGFKDGDPFGYIIRQNQEINKAIRYYQLLNLTKGALIRKELGFSTIGLRSTIPRAGRGIFVDGYAPAGTVISYFPGEVWPKEHITNIIATKFFENDPKQHLSMRYDDFLIDSRNAPYTVLDNDKSNPFAIAHIANHPAHGIAPNCSTVQLDFSEDMQLGLEKIDTYIPNTYAKIPSRFGQEAIALEKIRMHGMALITARDVENEELLYDYRLSPGEHQSYPDWYEVVDEDEIKSRWLVSK
jgi:hypothetical protein